MRNTLVWHIAAELVALGRDQAKRYPLLAGCCICTGCLLAIRVLFALTAIALYATPINIGRVSGSVLVNGSPGVGISIRFEPVTGDRASFAVTDSRGRYELLMADSRPGALVGDHRVRLTTSAMVPVRGDNERLIIQGETLPSRYNVTTELRANVVAGRNVFDWACDSRP